MKTSDPQNVFGKRLKQARTMSGLSLRSLSGKMNGIVSYNALNKYEKGEMMPNGQVIIAIANATGQSHGFFFRPHKPSIKEIKFRKKTKLGKKAESSISEKAQDFFERYIEIEQILGIKNTFKNPLKGTRIQTPEDAEIAANSIRSTWKLGQNALPNIHEMLEDNNIKVFEAESSDSFDGFSGWMSETPVVVISKRLNKQCLTRKRNTSVHELGHLLLKDQIDERISNKEEERIMNRFAAAMLLPKDVFLDELGSHRKSISLEELVDIKTNYGISIAAIVYRAHDLGCINDAMFERFWKHYNINGWRNGEPGDEEYKGIESSNRFKQLVLRAMTEELITRSKAAELLNQPLEEFRNSFSVFA